MSEEEGNAPTVGVVGDEAVVDALSAGGVTAVADNLRSVFDADPSVVVAVGEDALSRLARRRTDVPVLPVGRMAGLRSVPLGAVERVATRLAAGDWHVDSHPILEVERGDDRCVVMFDTMLVTAEPADISEYTVETGGEHVATFRADGVVVATPAGTAGYARTAGSPVVTPGMGALVVVPIAPFATDLDQWVVPLADLSLTVERNEAAVELLADDRSLGPVSSGDPVWVRAADELDVVVVPEGVSPYERDPRELEKL